MDRTNKNYNETSFRGPFKGKECMLPAQKNPHLLLLTIFLISKVMTCCLAYVDYDGLLMVMVFMMFMSII